MDTTALDTQIEVRRPECLLMSSVKVQKFMRKTRRSKYVTHTISLDCLTYLHVSKGFDIVQIVVDHLTRMAHFLPCAEGVTSQETANLFLQGVDRFHGLPRVLVSDRDPKLVSGF
jgi:uncharacterized protein YybS (DUF2232 family)